MVSVVMATFNGEQYIIKQLDTIRNQTKAPDEVVICDDCSRDKTVEKIKAYIKEYKLLHWYVYTNKKNIGYYDNFFQAISLSHGNVIFLSDQDDLWDLDKIKTVENLYYNNPKLMMVESNYKYIDPEDKPINRKTNYHGKDKVQGIISLETSDMCKFAGAGFTMSFRRSVYEMVESKGFIQKKDLFWFHDVLLGMAAAALGECVLISNIVDSHRLHAGNATQSQNTIFIADRTKKKQLDLVNGRVQKFEMFSDVCIDNERKHCFTHFKEFAKNRRDYISHFNFKILVTLVKQRNLYSAKLGLITDTMYSLGLEKILIYLYKRI